ncbi:Hsp70 family protein [Desulfosoma caldarium]|uniref:Hsp70 protein n=1 Tax=Desulfosoma caldarium TaxID=610254 RepID=A0A3N1VNP2_9BACT|nr:Hsp70 family protein [Desulfosoma caldarium]ROR01537.1 Hsp70 protein [Desulfosoma caldarium]
MMMEPISSRYVVGIDLGTTNSAMAYVDCRRADQERLSAAIRIFSVPQLVAPGETARRPLLPSFLYLPGSYDLPAGATALPWDPSRPYAVGEFAREQGALVPGRLVSSAKSWLCHAAVDRQAPILPWGAARDIPRMSPVEASARYLQHLREAWNHVMAQGPEDEENLLEEQLVILTVPASFDEVARELTVEAASQAGLKKVVLLEEPLAAFYAWLAAHEDSWEHQVQPQQLVLVCDVGGGTTDFTAIAVRSGRSGLRFDRLAVGEHLMLGGDNMDLTLARRLEMNLLGAPGKLDAQRWHQLCHGCRQAKEALLSEKAGKDRFDVTIMGTGGKLIAGTLKGTLTRDDVFQWILEGFFPPVSYHENPQESRRSGITEFGLPYVQDPAVTRHLAAFWRRHEQLLRQQTGRSAPYPDFILFNGGALSPAKIRWRLREVLGQWFHDRAEPGWMPKELDNPRPDLAVAVGAAYYGLVRTGSGVRVGAGTPRTYYLMVAGENLETDADPDTTPTHRAVCLMPRGTEEGYESVLQKPTFAVLTNQPASFQIFSSHTRLGDAQGDLVTLSPEEVTELPPIRTALRFGKRSTAQQVPVQIAIKLTEVGTLELWCRSLHTPHQWRLRFDVRRQGSETPPPSNFSAETVEEAVVHKARDIIAATFSKVLGPGVSEGNPEKLTKDLCDLLEMPRHKWSTSLIRTLADELLEHREGRALSPAHEARWLNLLGYCLRPGYGDPVDEWRLQEVWKMYPQGLRFPRKVQCRVEWWIFWRRVAGGLSAGRQWHIAQQVVPLLADEEPRKKSKKKSGLRLLPQEMHEVWMALANFERLSTDVKETLGNAVLKRILVRRPTPQLLWVFTRIAARTPLYGPADRVLSPQVVTPWIERILVAHPAVTEPVAQMVVHVARKTGDRARDVAEEVLERIERWLDGLGASAEVYRDRLRNPDSALRPEEESWLFGEALPLGLRLWTPEAESSDTSP